MSGERGSPRRRPWRARRLSPDHRRQEQQRTDPVDRVEHDRPGVDESTGEGVEELAELGRYRDVVQQCCGLGPIDIGAEPPRPAYIGGKPR